MATPPVSSRGPGERRRSSAVLPILVVLALLAVGLIYFSTRNTPNYVEERVDQPDPMPAPEPTSS